MYQHSAVYTSTITEPIRGGCKSLILLRCDSKNQRNKGYVKLCTFQITSTWLYRTMCAIPGTCIDGEYDCISFDGHCELSHRCRNWFWCIIGLYWEHFCRKHFSLDIIYLYSLTSSLYAQFTPAFCNGDVLHCCWDESDSDEKTVLSHGNRAMPV